MDATSHPSEEGMDAITISHAGTADIEPMSEIGAKAFFVQYEDATPFLYARIHAVSNESVRTGFSKELAAALQDTNRITIVARNASNEVVGFAMLSKAKRCVFLPAHHDTAKWACLDMLYVDPRYHGQTVRSRLLQEIEEICRKEGVGMMWLLVYDGNMPALNLYKKFAFVYLGDTRFFAQVDAENSFVLAKSIGGQDNATA